MLFIFYVTLVSVCHASLSVTFDFPTLPLLILQSELKWSEAELDGIQKQYKSNVQNGLERHVLSLPFTIKDVSFSYSIKSSTERERQLAMGTLSYLKKFLWLQVTLWRKHKCSTMDTKFANSNPHINCLSLIRFLIEQSRDQKAIFDKCKDDLVEFKRELGYNFLSTTRIAVQSVVLLSALETTSVDRESVLKCLCEALDLQNRAEQSSLLSSIAYERKSAFERFARAVDAGFISSPMSNVRLKAKLYGFEERKFEVYIMQSESTKGDELMERAKYLASLHKPLNLNMRLLDHYDPVAVQKFISDQNEAVVIISNITDPLQLIEEYKKSRNSLYLGYSSEANFALHEYYLRASFVGDPLEEELKSAIGRKSVSNTTSSARISTTEQYSYMLRNRYQRIAIPIHFVAFYTNRIAPKLSLFKTVSHLSILAELSADLQSFAMLVHESIEVGKIADGSVKVNPVKDYRFVYGALNRTTMEFANYGIKGRILATHLVCHSMHQMNFELMMGLNDCLVFTPDYSENLAQLSSKMFFEKLCAQCIGNLELAKDTSQMKAYNSEYFRNSVRSFMVLMDGSDETNDVLRTVGFFHTFMNRRSSGVI